MKKAILIPLMALLVLVKPVVVSADGSTKVEKVCTTNQYGETTCSEKTNRVVVHKPVDAAFGDVNTTLILFGLLGSAGIAYLLSKKVNQI